LRSRSGLARPYICRDLARMGWELHAIATFAGQRHTDSTLQYIHLPGRDLADKLNRIKRPSEHDQVPPGLQVPSSACRREGPDLRSAP
jgi:hypothetical protein